MMNDDDNEESAHSDAPLNFWRESEIYGWNITMWRESECWDIVVGGGAEEHHRE